MNKFEKLIEYIINDEDQKARALFHDIVVEKSRDIYESIMDEEAGMDEVAGMEVEDMVDEVSQEESMGEAEEEGGEEFSLDGDADADGAPDGAMGDAPAAGDEFGDAEEHKEIEGTVMNIDSKLDELLAKFDSIMGGGDEAPAEEPAMDMGDNMGAEKQPEEFAEAKEGSGNPFAKGSGKSGSAQSGKSGSAQSGKSGSGKMESRKTATELMREYVETVGDIYGGAGDATEGTPVGTGTGSKKAPTNSKSVTGPGADFGGTSIKAKGGEQNQDGTSPAAADKPELIKSGNVNVPGGKAGAPKSTGHEYTKDAKGAEGQTTGGKLPVATKSVQVQNTGRK
jgi:hypothetical protein